MYIITAEKIYTDLMGDMQPTLCLYKGPFCHKNDYYYGIFCRLDYRHSGDSLYDEKSKFFRSKRAAEEVASTMLDDDGVRERIQGSVTVEDIINPTVWDLEDYIKVAAMEKLKGGRRYPLWYIK